MKHFTIIKDFFRPPNLAEIISTERQIEEATIAECDKAITNALFQKSLSTAKLKALNEWAATSAYINSTATNTARKETP